MVGSICFRTSIYNDYSFCPGQETIVLTGGYLSKNLACQGKQEETRFKKSYAKIKEKKLSGNFSNPNQS
jgi:hypothetical protein